MMGRVLGDGFEMRDVIIQRGDPVIRNWGGHVEVGSNRYSNRDRALVTLRQARLKRELECQISDYLHGRLPCVRS